MGNENIPEDFRRALPILAETQREGLAEAVVPAAVKSNRISQSLDPPLSAANFHSRAAFNARFAKYWLGPAESSDASVTSPLLLVVAFTVTWNLP